MGKIDEVINWFQLMGVNDIVIPKQLDHKEKTFRNNIESITKLEDLKIAIESVDCELKNTANKMVFSDGNVNSKLVFIGEAPGAEEDKTGLPFVGQSGKLLNKAIEAIGLKREEVYVTNVVPWRPLGNRTPTQAEISLYRPFLVQHINIINPKLIVCLGSSAMRAVLQNEIGISKVRGKIFDNNGIFKNETIKIIATFHPSYLLRSLEQKREFWKDFLKIKELMKIN